MFDEAASPFHIPAAGQCKMQQYTKFEPKIPRHVEKELRAFSLKEVDPKMMLGEASSPFCIPVAGQC